MSKAYRVHEFAALAGVTPKALRHYDRLGLLKPLRSAAGYRVYSKKHLARLEQIVALRFLGLPLREIKNVLDRGTPLSDALPEQRTVLQEKRQLLDRAIPCDSNRGRRRRVQAIGRIAPFFDSSLR